MGKELLIVGGIFLIVAFLFIVPIINHSFLAINIIGQNESAKINSISIINIKKPVINLFSSPNPVGNFNLELIAKNNNGTAIFSGKALNFGWGDSIFMITNMVLSGNLTLESTLYLGNQYLDKNITNQEIKLDG